MTERIVFKQFRFKNVILGHTQEENHYTYECVWMCLFQTIKRHTIHTVEYTLAVYIDRSVFPDH